MGFPDDSLDPDEDVVFDLRPHWRRVAVVPGVLVVVAGLASYLWFVVPSGRARVPVHVAVVVVAVGVLARWALWPWLTWRCTRYVVTDRRLLVRWGVASRTGRDLALGRVASVTFTRGVADRVFGSGTVWVDQGGDRGRLVLRDVPAAETVARELGSLIDRADDGSR